MTLLEIARHRIATLPPDACETARFIVAVAEGVPALRREHATDCGSRAAERYVNGVAPPWADLRCTCGADAANVVLDGWRKMLDEEDR